MKTKFLLSMIILTIAMVSSALAAPYVEIRPVGTVLTSPGADLDFDIYLVNGDSEWGMYMYAYSLWLDPDELEYVGFDYRDPAGILDTRPGMGVLMPTIRTIALIPFHPVKSFL
jgi:hypothetical protein